MDEHIIQRIIEPYGLAPTRSGSGWDLRLPAHNNLVCNLYIAPGAYDWYATVVDQADGQELWTDWMDYIGYDDSSEAALIELKQQHLASFIESWVTATNMRVSRQRKSRLWGLLHTSRTQVEWEHVGVWRPIQIWDELPPNPRMQPTGRGGPLLRSGGALPEAQRRKR